MQATRPLNTSNIAKAGFFAVVAAAAILIVATMVATIAPSFGRTTDTGAGASATEVERALIQHRAGERGSLAGVPSATELEQALIQHRAGEKSLGADQAPVVLDPDTREGWGWKQAGPGVPQ